MLGAYWSLINRASERIASKMAKVHGAMAKMVREDGHRSLGFGARSAFGRSGNPSTSPFSESESIGLYFRVESCEAIS